MSRRTLFFLSTCFFLSNLLAAQTLIEEHFDLGIPNDWSQTTNASDGGWLYGNAQQLDSEYWPIFDPPDDTPFIATNDDGCDCNKSEDYLILPEINFRSDSDYAYMEIEYVFRGQSWTDDNDIEYTEELFLKVSFDNGLSWELVEELPGDLTDNWRTHRIDLSAYTNKENVVFAFHYFDDDGWTWGAALNLVKIVQPYKLDATIEVTEDLHPFQELGKAFTLSATFVNQGTEVINNIVFDLISPNGSKELIFNYDLDFEESLTLQFQDPIIIDSPDKHSYSFKIKSINGSEDINPMIESTPYNIYGVENAPTKRIFIENLVGLWCGACPLAYVYADYINNNYSEHSSVSNIHLSSEFEYDPLELIDYTQEISYLVYNSPLAIINRKVGTAVPYPLEVIDLEQSYINVMKDQASPVGLNILASNNGMDNVIDFNINLSFHTNITDIQYNVLFLVNKNNISGIENAYVQNNDFSGSNIIGLEYWTELNNPAEDFILNNVLHSSLFSDFNGFEGLIPSAINNGSDMQFGASFTIPEGLSFDDFDFHLLITDAFTGEILNSSTVNNIQIISSLNDQLVEKSIVFAHQEGEDINLDLSAYRDAHSVQMVSMEGRLILSNTHVYSADNEHINLKIAHIPSGLYMIILNDEKGNKIAKQLLFYQ